MQILGRAVAIWVAMLFATCVDEAQARPLRLETQARPVDLLLIVRGEKAARPLQNTPASVVITTNRSIAEQNLTTAYDILDRAPNVVVDGNRTTFSIRGVDAFNVSGSGDGPLASVYVDGAAIPRLALASGPLDLYDVAQVEVFRGPQSTIQGRNALAGAVIINTVDPGFEWTGKARLLVSNEKQEKRAGIAIGGPLINDQLAFRVTGEASHAAGLIRNITRDERADRQHSRTLRGKLLLTPDAVPRLRIIGSVLYDRHQRGTFYSDLDPPYDRYERVSTADAEDIKRGTSSIAGLTALYDLGVGKTLTSVTNVSRIRFRSISDADRTDLAGQISRIDDSNRTFQQEFRLNFRRPGVEGLIGAFFLRDRQAYDFSATQTLTFRSLGVDRQLQATGLPPGVVDAVLNLYGGMLPIRNSLAQWRVTQNFAFFSDLTMAVDDRFRLHAGLRYDRESQDRESMQAVSLDRSLPDPTNLANQSLATIVARLNNLLLNLVQSANNGEPARHVTYHAWLPKLGATYDLAKNVALSATIQRGYRAGGTGLNQQRAENYSFKPEFTTNYEAALRSTWLDNRLTLNANLYRTEWTDQQVTVQLTPGSLYDTRVMNAGRSRLYGFEIETRAAMTTALHLYAGAGFSSAKFKDFTVEPGSSTTTLKGKQFPRAPRWTVSGGATLSVPRGLLVNINANYRSAYFQSVLDQNAKDIAGRTLVNAKIGWQGRRVSAYLTASNIFNVQQPDQFFIDLDGRRRGTLNDPRILGLVVETEI